MLAGKKAFYTHTCIYPPKHTRSHTQEQQKELEADLEAANKHNKGLLADKAGYDSSFRKLTADKAKLESEVKRLRDEGQKFAKTEYEEMKKAYRESQEKVGRLEKDLTRYTYI